MRFEECYYKTKQMAWVEARNVSACEQLRLGMGSCLTLSRRRWGEKPPITTIWCTSGGTGGVYVGYKCYSSTQRSYCRLVTILERETKASALTWEAISISPSGIFSGISGQNKLIFESGLKHSNIDDMGVGILKGGNKSTVGDGSYEVRESRCVALWEQNHVEDRKQAPALLPVHPTQKRKQT